MGPVSIRLIIASLGVYACALVYSQRASISVAIVAMTTVVETESDESTNQTYECKPNVHNQWTVRSREVSTREPEFDWSEKLKGTILGSQFYLYIIVPSIAGRITDIFGAKWVAFAGALGPCILSLITPVATRGFGAPALIAIRTLMGGFHGCIFSAMFSLYIKWFPVKERVNANAGLVFGSSIGSSVMYLLAGWLCNTGPGWPLVFYVNTVLYLPWMALWLYYCTNDPNDNLRISSEELDFIRANVPQSKGRKRAVPWSGILTSHVVLASLMSKMCAGFGYYLINTKMPAFLSTIFGVPILQNGAFNSATAISHGIIGLLAAPLSNWCIKRFAIRSIIIRKVFQGVAMLGPGICAGLVPVFGCDSTSVIVMLLGCMMLYGFYTGGEWTTVSEFAPNSAGAVFGFTNILAFAQGVIAPYLVGALLDSDAGGSHHAKWNLVFLITAGVYVCGFVVFLFIGTDQQQSWDKIGNDNDNTTDDEVESGPDKVTLAVDKNNYQDCIVNKHS